MSFITGLLLIDAPDSALNNAGKPPNVSDENQVATKVIKVPRDGSYPYVSAQAFRYWLRESLRKYVPAWQASPVYKESENLAYTYADPITYWDDDLMGYMRAPSKGTAKERQEDEEHKKLPSLVEKKKGKDGKEKETEVGVTRVSPLRVSTLVSIAPVILTDDQKGMFRHEGNPVLYRGQSYRATLKGLFSLDLNACGTFTHIERTGYRNLGATLKKKAEESRLEPVDGLKAYRLPIAQRLERVTALFEGIARLEGGAKQTLHYTDVAPAMVALAVTKGGNHIFGHIIGANSSGLPELKVDALQESLRVFSDDLLSNVYIGWMKGYADEARAKLEEFLKPPKLPAEPTEEQKKAADELKQLQSRIRVMHPREAFAALIADLTQNLHWLD